MRKKGYSYRGFWGQTKHFDNNGNLRGESYRNFWGGRTHRDPNFNVTGYSYRNFWGGYTRYDKDMNKIGYSFRNFWGGIDYFDEDMNRTGSSYRNLWGGSNYYDRRDEMDQEPQRDYPLAGISQSDARINSETRKASFVDYGTGKNSSQSDFQARRHNETNSRVVDSESTYASGTLEKDTRDLWGLEAIRGKSCEEILIVLKTTKRVMDDLYNYISEDSGFRKELFDDTQLYKDFWLYTLANQLEVSSFTGEQKIKVLGLLLQAFLPDSPTTADQYYSNMKNNAEYRKYMTDCFSVKSPHEGFFWTNMSHMGSVYDELVEQKIQEHIPLVMNFSIGHFRFFMQLEVYLKKMFQGYGFGENVKNRLLKKMDQISETFIDDIELEKIVFLNPLYDIWVSTDEEDADV